jgi:hypothetical protein
MGSTRRAGAGAAEQVLRAHSLLEEGLEEGSSLLERDLAVQAVPLGLRPGGRGGRGELEAGGRRRIFDPEK